MTESDSIGGPILAPRGASPAEASQPNQPLDGEHFHTYESHPVPWWISLVWISFFAFGIIYLISNMLR
jgi:hypothetical protein